jgi:hypothetical protein
MATSIANLKRKSYTSYEHYMWLPLVMSRRCVVRQWTGTAGCVPTNKVDMTSVEAEVFS